MLSLLAILRPHTKQTSVMCCDPQPSCCIERPLHGLILQFDAMQTLLDLNLHSFDSTFASRSFRVLWRWLRRWWQW